jgi:adenylate cyclase, class 2
MAAGTQQEVEIKFRVTDAKALARALRSAGFRVKTRRTHEMNLLFDSADGSFSARGEVLRIRRYGKQWTLTHKSRGADGRHKVREETEATVADGEALAHIFQRLGFLPRFRYEKLRTEWSDGKGHVVIDETPIGTFAEIEGTPGWIDRTAKKLGITSSHYLTASYVALFFEWRKLTGSRAAEMTWESVGAKKPR